MSTNNRLRLPVIGVAVALFGIRAATAAEFVYLENSDSGEVSVIDIPGHTVVSTIKVGPFLDDVTPSRDGRILYVNRYDSLGLGDQHVAESGEVIALSTETEKVLWRTRVDGWPNHLTISLDDRLLYVPLFNTLWMEVIDTQAHKVIRKFPIGFGGHGTRLSPDGKRIYVGSMMTDVLSVFDLETLKPVKVLPFKDAVRPFAFTHDESTVYVQLSRLHGFEVVDLSTDKIVREVLLPKLGPDIKLPRFYPHTYNHGLELSPDEKLLFASGGIANYVCVYHVPDLALVATIPVGREPNWIAFSKDGSFAYVSNRKSDNVSVISVRDLKEIKRIRVGKYPQRIRVVDVPTRWVAAKDLSSRGG
jgi:YVTN family beta-propeller protein